MYRRCGLGARIDVNGSSRSLQQVRRPRKGWGRLMSSGIHRRGRSRLTAIVCVAFVVTSMLAGNALANPRASQYDNPAPKEPTKVVKQGVLAVKTTKKTATSAQAPVQATSGTLPFTGLDLALIVG